MTACERVGDCDYVGDCVYVCVSECLYLQYLCVRVFLNCFCVCVSACVLVCLCLYFIYFCIGNCG